MRGEDSEGLLQLRLRVGEGVTLHEFLELRPGVAGEQRAQRRLVGLDEVGRAGIEFREQLGQLRRGFAGLRRDQPAQPWLAPGFPTQALQGGPQLREQGIERGGDLLLGGIHFRGGGPVANEFLQSARRPGTLAPMLPATPLSVCARRSARAMSPWASAAVICSTAGPCCSMNWRRSFRYSFRLPATRVRPSFVSRPSMEGRSSGSEARTSASPVLQPATRSLRQAQRLR